MKISKINIAFFIVGVAAFSYLLYQLSLEQFVLNVQRAGLSLLYVILTWLVIYLLNTLAWKTVLGGIGNRLSFGRMFMITVSGFSINTVTPVLAVGGEPFRVKILAETLGTHRSISAVMLYRMVYFFGHMSSILAGIACGIASLELFTALRLFLSVVFLGVSAAMLWALSIHKRGIFERLLLWTQRFSVLRRVFSALEKRRQALREMDSVLTDVYKNKRGKFYFSVFLEFVSRLLMALELYIILHGVGIDVGFAGALFLYALYSILINLFFFIPLNLGIREGGLMLGLQSLALAPLLGVYVGIVIRIRDLFWIAIGLVMILLTGQEKLKTQE